MTKRKKVTTTTTKPNPFAYDPTYDGTMACWLFLPFGLIMPCVDRAQPDLITVRARDEAHLAAFREQFCPELENPAVATPDRDYDFRAVVSRAAFVRAMVRIGLAIDSPRMKPTSEPGAPLALADQEKAAAYHSALVRVWSVATELSERWRSWGSTDTGTGKKPGNGESTTYGMSDRTKVRGRL